MAEGNVRKRTLSIDCRETHHANEENEMSDKLSRRDFVAAGLAAGVVGSKSLAFAQAPAVKTSGAAKPVVIASANGYKYTNGGERTCVEEAFERMARG